MELLPEHGGDPSLNHFTILSERLRKKSAMNLSCFGNNFTLPWESRARHGASGGDTVGKGTKVPRSSCVKLTCESGSRHTQAVARDTFRSDSSTTKEVQCLS